MSYFEPIRRTVTLAGAAGIVYALTQPSHAYCVRNGDFIGGWSEPFPDLVIDVRVASIGPSSTENIGQSPENVARIVTEVIARHNEGVAVPKLRFAGLTTAQWKPDSDTPHEQLDTGITILSFRCEDITALNENNLCGVLTDSGRHACASSLGVPNISQMRGWVILAPAGCDKISTPADKWNLSGTPDVAQVLLHEIGHTLGLQHSNSTKAVCEDGSNTQGGDPKGAMGVMQTAAPALYPAFRSWRRDDFEGLGHLYNAALEPLEIAWWDDAFYPAYPAEDQAHSLIGMDVSRSVAVSNQSGRDWQVMATTSPEGRVLHRILDAGGHVTPALGDAVVDPGPSGRTWAMPAVATGWSGLGAEDRILVAWFANEETDSSTVSLRIASRSISDLAWSYEDHPDPFRVNRLAASFIPDRQMFILTTMMEQTSEIAVLLFDAEGNSLGSPRVLAGRPAFDVGTPRCTDSRCLIPFSEPIFGGPNFGVVEVEVDADGTLAVVSDQILASLDTRGRLAVLDETQGLNLVAAIGAGRIFLGNYPGIVPDGALADLDADWPLGIGHWEDGQGGQTRIFQPRAVVCGNGIVQAGESCDDKNTIAGDGCDACALEPNSDSGATGQSDEVGDTGVGADDLAQGGCECRSSSRGVPVISLFALGLLGLRRRR